MENSNDDAQVGPSEFLTALATEAALMPSDTVPSHVTIYNASHRLPSFRGAHAFAMLLHVVRRSRRDGPSWSAAFPPEQEIENDLEKIREAARAELHDAMSRYTATFLPKVKALKVDVAEPGGVFAPILRHFDWAGMAPAQTRLVAPLKDVAQAVVFDHELTGPETSAGLRKLLEARDCFLRALSEKQRNEVAS